MKKIKHELKDNQRVRDLAPSARPTGRLTMAIIGCIAALIHTADAGGGNSRGFDPCVRTARFVYFSDLAAARSDYSLALAKANNEPTADQRREATIKTGEDYRDAVSGAKEKFSARRDLCRDLGEDRYNPVIDPADFLSVSEIAANPNPLFPLIPGTTTNYRSETDEGTETIAVAVTSETREILGVTCLVIRDTVRLDGEIIEDTEDWYAQDRSGNVWYFGENTAEYENGLIVSIDGAWEAGIEGAQPGIVMFAQPVVGQTYRQELFYGEAEDAAKIISLNEIVTVLSGTYTQCLQTEDFTPIEPGVREFKYYAPGVGNVLTVDPETGKRSELVSIQTE